MQAITYNTTVLETAYLADARRNHGFVHTCGVCRATIRGNSYALCNQKGRVVGWACFEHADQYPDQFARLHQNARTYLEKVGFDRHGVPTWPPRVGDVLDDHGSDEQSWYDVERVEQDGRIVQLRPSRLQGPLGRTPRRVEVTRIEDWGKSHGPAYRIQYRPYPDTSGY